MNFEQIIHEKYPDGYLDHFLSMFNSNLSKDNILAHVGFAENIEGTDYLLKVRDEFQLVINNKDGSLFVQKMVEQGYASFDVSWLTQFKTLIEDTLS